MMGQGRLLSAADDRARKAEISAPRAERSRVDGGHFGCDPGNVPWGEVKAPSGAIAKLKQMCSGTSSAANTSSEAGNFLTVLTGFCRARLAAVAADSPHVTFSASAIQIRKLPWLFHVITIQISMFL